MKQGMGEQSMHVVFTRAIAHVPQWGFTCWAVTAAAMDAGYSVFGWRSEPRQRYESLMHPQGAWYLNFGWHDQVERAARSVGWSRRHYRMFMLSMAAESQR